MSMLPAIAHLPFTKDTMGFSTFSNECWWTGCQFNFRPRDGAHIDEHPVRETLGQPFIVGSALKPRLDSFEASVHISQPPRQLLFLLPLQHTTMLLHLVKFYIEDVINICHHQQGPHHSDSCTLSGHCHWPLHWNFTASQHPCIKNTDVDVMHTINLCLRLKIQQAFGLLF